MFTLEYKPLFRLWGKHLTLIRRIKSKEREECYKIFYLERTLWEHLRKCHRENNYTCKHCENKFDNKNDLREHQSRTHGEKLCAFAHCEQAFKWEDMLYLFLCACSACASLAYLSIWRLDHNDDMHTVFRCAFDLCVLLGRFCYRIFCHNVYIRIWENMLTLCKQIR